MTPSAPFQLRLFGTPSLIGPNGQPLRGRAAQRHRMALLALLARAPAGLSRDQLTGLLWPERDREQARNLLNVSLYVARRSLGGAAIGTEGDNVRLSPGVVATDVGEFEAARAAGDLEVAVALYSGPFLDGFYLRDSGEFDRWVERERSRLAGSQGAALRELGERAENRGDSAEAARWWQALAAHDPYDSRVALRVMQALAVAGNVGGALRHGELHERLLRDDLGVDAATDVRALAEHLRGGVPARPATEPSSMVRSAMLPAESSAGVGAALSDGSAVRASGRRRRMVRAALAVASVAAALTLILPKVLEDESGAVTVPGSIAVLPLANRGVPADQPLADGMTDQLIAALARAGLRVSTLAFDVGGGPDLGRVADSLGVAYVLEGGWEKLGEQFRVQLRLTDPRDRSTRWSDAYERSFQDVFAVQEEISRDVAREILPRVGSTPTARAPTPLTRNVAAYEAYARANDVAATRSDSAAQEALSLYREAVELDPSFAAAWAGLARFHLRVTPREAPEMSRSERWRHAEEYALEALSLDGSFADAHGTLGLVHLYQYRFAESEADFKRALALDPSRALNREWLVQLYVWTGRFDEALAEALRAFEADPLSASARAEVARGLLLNGRCPEAMRELNRLAGLDPPLLRVGPIAAQCHGRAGDWDEALAAVSYLGPTDRERAVVAYYLARAGRPAAAREVLADLADRERRTGAGAFLVAMVHTGLGDIDQAFDALDRSLTDGSLTFEMMEPMFGALHRDPRFDALMERLGVPGWDRQMRAAGN